MSSILIYAGAQTVGNLTLQERLIELGYDVGPDGADGIFGRETAKAVRMLQADYGLEVTGDVRSSVDDPVFSILFPEIVEQAQRGKKAMFGISLKGLLSAFASTTLLKYVVAAVAQYLAVKFGVDEGQLTGILLQIVTVLMGLWGVGASAQDKVVVNGQKVLVSKLPEKDENIVRNIVYQNK